MKYAVAYNPSDASMVAPEQTMRLVDCGNVVETERLDANALPRRPMYHAVKRLFDVFACGAALVILSPVMVLIALAIRLDSPGPAIFKQERLGKDGKPFVMYKFRSMRLDAEANGAMWAELNDSRTTRVGRVIRHCRLDELPQFWNVVKGDMSLIGPRPEREIFYKEFEKYVHGFSQRLLVIPGITGYAQVMGGYELMPAEKVTYDIEYIKRQSFLLDTEIIVKTFAVLVSHKGAR